MRIVPIPDALTQPYWDGTQLRQLRIQHCTACSACWHPPQPVCPRCQSPAIDWRPVCGAGVLYSFTEIHHAAHSALAARVPYTVGLVQLEEGPCVVCNIVGAESCAVHIGMRLNLVFEEISPGIVLPQFAPAAA